MKYISFTYQGKQSLIIRTPKAYIFYSQAQKRITQWRKFGCESYEKSYGSYTPKMKLTENCINAIFAFAEGYTDRLILRPDKPWYWPTVKALFSAENKGKYWDLCDLDIEEAKKLRNKCPEAF